MKPSVKFLLIAGVALLLTVLAATMSPAQHIHTRSSGTSLPATCNVWDEFDNTSTGALSLCSAPNTWFTLSGAAGTGTINSGTTNQLGYYAANGTTISGLTLGTNLSITSGTLNASGGSGTYPAPVTVDVTTAAAELDLTSCITSSYRDYDIRFSHITMASGSGVSLLVQFSTNNGSSWDTASNYHYGGQYVQLAGGTATGSTGGQSGTGIAPTFASADTFSSGDILNFRMRFDDPLSTADSVKLGGATSEEYISTSSTWGHVGSFYYANASGVNAVRLVTTGTLTGQGTCQPLAQ